MTGSSPSGAYHIATVLPSTGAASTRFWVPLITAGLVLLLGLLLMVATGSRVDEPAPAGAPSAASAPVRG